MRIYYLLLIMIFAFSCRQNSPKRVEPNQLSTELSQDFLTKGEKIALESQKALMSKVLNAINDEGLPGAVEYCNLHAIPLTDSLALSYGITLQRLTDQTRNPLNDITTEEDKEAWTILKEMHSDSSATFKHLLKQVKNDIYYYKPISIVMPTCLSCHGAKNQDITPDTWNVISEKYPNDKATGYTLGDMRGMWKIKFSGKDM